MRRPSNTLSTKQGNDRLKHIDVAYLRIQDAMRTNILRVRSVKSEENVADVGTKAFSKAVFWKLCPSLGEGGISTWTKSGLTSAQQDVAMLWDSGSGPVVRDVWQNRQLAEHGR